MTREKRWRSDLLKLVAPQPGDRIVDIGCGTGTLAIALKGGEPESEIFAVDPDPAVLEIARSKARTAGADIHWFEAMGDELRSEENTSELQSLMRISYAVFCLQKKLKHIQTTYNNKATR